MILYSRKFGIIGDTSNRNWVSKAKTPMHLNIDNVVKLRNISSKLNNVPCHCK